MRKKYGIWMVMVAMLLLSIIEVSAVNGTSFITPAAAASISGGSVNFSASWSRGTLEQINVTRLIGYSTSTNTSAPTTLATNATINSQCIDAGNNTDLFCGAGIHIPTAWLPDSTDYIFTLQIMNSSGYLENVTISGIKIGNTVPTCSYTSGTVADTLTAKARDTGVFATTAQANSVTNCSLIFYTNDVDVFKTFTETTTTACTVTNGAGVNTATATLTFGGANDLQEGRTYKWRLVLDDGVSTTNCEQRTIRVEKSGGTSGSSVATNIATGTGTVSAKDSGSKISSRNKAAAGILGGMAVLVLAIGGAYALGMFGGKK